MADRPPQSTTAPARPRGILLELLRDPYTIAGLVIFALIVVDCWTSYVETHEMIYLLGTRRVFDPSFLAADFTWANLPPTSFLFDHLLAPLWGFCSEFTIANAGRFVTWIALVCSLVSVARAIKLPAWSLFAGFALWLMWRQTIASCGAPLEGLQVKSFAYPYLLFAIALVIRGRVGWAGALAGLGTAFHIVVGGWGFFALLLSMLFNRKLFTLRQVGIFVASATPFIAPLLLAVTMFHGGHTSSAEQAVMDKIYVLFAMPHCCDLRLIMAETHGRWMRAVIVFAISPVLIFGWPERRAAQILGVFVVALIAFFFAGAWGQYLGLYGLLKLYPAQVGNSFPALFLFMFLFGWMGKGPVRHFGIAVWSIVLLGTLWIVVEREVVNEIAQTPGKFANEVWGSEWGRPPTKERLYAWIRANTPESSVFITPFIHEFWVYAERAQVASMRHPPLDRRLIEWKARLEALNGFHPYKKRGFDITDELNASEGALTAENLVRIRGLYGATHYLMKGSRADLADHLLHTDLGYSVYDVTALRAAGASAASDSDLELRTAASHPMRYYLSRPKGWTSSRTWPVVIVIEAATREFEKNAREFVAARGDAPFIIVAPLTLTSGGTAQNVAQAFSYGRAAWDRAAKDGNCAFDEAGLDAVIADVRRRDSGSSSVYITGWEAGGHVVWDQVFRHPERLRAAALVVPNFQSRCLDESDISTAPSRAALPVIAFHGSRDSSWGASQPLYVQWLRARDLAIAHGYRGLSDRLVPGEGHSALAMPILAAFDTLERRSPSPIPH